LTGIEVLAGEATPLANEPSLFITGATMLSPAQRRSDPRSPTLSLDGQAFFDSPWPGDPVAVLLLIGGPENTPAMGEIAAQARVEAGSLKDQPVRAFRLAGADARLAEALPALAGWQAEQNLETARAALNAPHPLIAIDALRIAVQSRATDQVELLAGWLLHPAQPAGVKAVAISLLGEAIALTTPGSSEADALIGVAVAGWEAERAYPIDASYLRAFQTAAEQVKASERKIQVEAIAGDYQIQELNGLSEALRERLK
jgi:hypothetical protein